MSEVIEGQPVEGTGTEIARVMAEGDPETMLAVLEKKAQLAPRMKAAIETMLVSQTYPEDWTIQGDGDRARACLGSAGAERVGRNFPIRFRDILGRREDFADSAGKGYRYVYTGYAELYDRIVYAEGSYSTRDEFLGKVHGDWRPLEDINEGDIRSAAHHIFMGNAVKQLLGLRGMPLSAYQKIMPRTGQDATKSAAVRHAEGGQGGTAKGKASAAMVDRVKVCLRALRPGDSAGPAREILFHEVADFTNDKGEKVVAPPPDRMSEKWLGRVIGKLDEVCAAQGIDPNAPPAPEVPAQEEPGTNG